MEQKGRERLQAMIADINAAFQAMDFVQNSLLNNLSTKLNELLVYIESLEDRIAKLENAVDKKEAE